jgi:hypothetical protein
MNENQQLARPFREAALKLRLVRSRVVGLIKDRHVVTGCWPPCAAVLVAGLDTARALEHLAGLLDEGGR